MSSFTLHTVVKHHSHSLRLNDQRVSPAECQTSQKVKHQTLSLNTSMYAWTIPQIYSPLFPLFFLKHITASCLSQTCLNWLKRVLGMGNGGVTKHVSGRAVSKIRKGDWIVWRHSLYQFPELMGNFSFLPCFASRGPGRRRPSSSGAAQGPLRPRRWK